MTQADKYFESFFDYFEIIVQRPFSFESVDYIKTGYRLCVCGSDSIYFKVNNDIVEIMAIVGRQIEIIKSTIYNYIQNMSILH